MIEVIEFYSPKPGASLLFFGAIHGNERCGTQAIERVVQALRSGTIELKKGNAIFVPIANPHAYNNNIRYVKENLNRIFRQTRKPRSLEGAFANVLCALVDRCDVLLDIHSTTAHGEPFVYLDYPNRRNRAYARTLGPGFGIVGWPELYKRLGRDHLSFDTTSYAAQQGKDGLIIECGQHDALSSPEIAHGAILNSLRHYGLIAGKQHANRFAEIKITAAYFRKHKKDRLASNWKHLDIVHKGEDIIFNADGTILSAPYDAHIIMPKATAPVGDDWLYLGKKSNK